MVWFKLSNFFVSVDLMQTFMEYRKINFSSYMEDRSPGPWNWDRHYTFPV